MAQDAKSIFCTRLKAARKAKNLSQEKLGILIELDEFVASTRINRYEQGVHTVEPNTAQRLAQVLDVPLAYFYAETDDLADLITNYSRLNQQQKNEILQSIELINKTTNP